MAEKNDNENNLNVNDSHSGDTDDNIKDNDENLENSRTYYQNDVQVLDENSSNPLDSGTRREENPFSFKRFLNQDGRNLKNHHSRRKNFLSERSGNENSTFENQSYNFNVMDNNTKVLNTNEMTSVLPDFVQDHLVIEQCYLNGTSSTINIDNLNLHNLPDLNIEHRCVNFSESTNGQRSDMNHHSLSAPVNLPDFTSDVNQYSRRSDTENFYNKTLPDFTVNTTDGGFKTLDRINELYNGRECLNRNKNNHRTNDTSESNLCNKSSCRISSSPSVPLDLPSYDGSESVLIPPASLDQPIPFDLTVAAEDRNSSHRGMQTTETVSKSLPDFLSDGPIQNDRMGENLQLGNLVSSLHESDDQRVSSEGISERYDGNRFRRELDMLRRQLLEKNRRIHMLESEIEDLRARERRDLSGLEYTIRLQVERNLKQAMERASNAESALVKSRQENNRLRSKLSSLRGENSNSKSDNASDACSDHVNNQRIAKELRIAANAAENSLRSLLTGIDNLRMIAASVENMENCSKKTDELEDLNNEDSASGPAL